jgi:hypothetical protein
MPLETGSNHTIGGSMRPLLSSLLLLFVACGPAADAQRVPPVSSGTPVPNSAPTSETQAVADLANETVILSVLSSKFGGYGAAYLLPNLPVETRLALAFPSNTPDGVLQGYLPAIDAELNLLSSLSKNDGGLDLFITRSSGAYLRESALQNEVAANGLITAERAVEIIRFERAISASVGAKLKAAVAEVTASIQNRLSRRPDLRQKLLADEKTASRELVQSRARVKSVLDDARRKTGI